MVLILPDAWLKSCCVLAHCFKLGLCVAQSVKGLGKDVDKTKVSTSWVGLGQCRVLWSSRAPSVLCSRSRTRPFQLFLVLNTVRVFLQCHVLKNSKLFEAANFNFPHCLGFCSMQTKGAALSFHQAQERSQSSWSSNKRPAESGRNPYEKGKAVMLAPWPWLPEEQPSGEKKDKLCPMGFFFFKIRKGFACAVSS